ncbi:MAG: septal ring lytic transglycosylase RlpA family protein [Chloroflexota bacterium]
MFRRLLAALLAAALVGTAVNVWSGRAGAATGDPLPDAVSSRLVEIGGHLVGEILVGGDIVIRIRAPLGGYTVEERTETVATRLSAAVESGIMPYHFGIDYADGTLILTADGRQLVAVDRSTAQQAGGTPLSIAVIWLKNIRRALGWEPLVDWRDQLASRANRTWNGTASWYGPGFHGRTTASGEQYDMHGYTAAHKSLPFGTQLLVTSIDTGLSVIVRVNDRGPFVPGRELDLSRAAAAAIGMIGSGVSRVRIDHIR